MKKVKKITKDNLIYTIISAIIIIILLVMTIWWIKRGTYSIDDESSLNITCPNTAAKDETIECDVSFTSSDTPVLAINANYDLDETIEYVSFDFTDICSTDECREGLANTENGFAIAKIDGIANNTVIGKLRVKLPATANKDDTLEIGLKNIELTYSADELPTSIPNTSVEVTIVEKQNEITLACPANATAGQEIDCDVELTAYDETITEVSADYNFTEGLEYVSFDTGVCAACVDCEIVCFDNVNGTNSSFEATITNTNIDAKAYIGTLKVKIPANASKDDTYVVGFTNIKVKNNNNVTSSLDNVSATITIIEVPSEDMFATSLIVDEDNKIIKRLTEKTKYSDLLTNINEKATISLKSNDDNTLTGDSIIKTGDQITITLNEKTETYTISVLGDLTGDGEIKINDISNKRY